MLLGISSIEHMVSEIQHSGHVHCTVRSIFRFLSNRVHVIKLNLFVHVRGLMAQHVIDKKSTSSQARGAKHENIQVRHFRMIRKWPPTVTKRAKH